MPSPLASYAAYSRFLFDLLAEHPTIDSHTLTIYTISPGMGTTRGQIVFHSGYVLHVYEQLDFVTHCIRAYSYELEYQGERLWWYDPMPHPDIPELQSTHPHHKHVEPDIKHHRIPAPGLSFTQPNLPALITEVESL